MISIRSNLAAVERDLQSLARQPRYAMSVALNAVAERIRDNAIHHTFPMGFELRNKGLPQGILTTKKSRADDLTASIFDRRGLDYLPRHDEGGIKTARGGNGIAVPDDSRRTPLRSSLFEHSDIAAKRGPKGMPPSQRPRALLALRGVAPAPKWQEGKVTWTFKKGKAVRYRKEKFSTPFIITLKGKQFLVRRDHTSNKLELLYSFPSRAVIDDDQFLWTEDATRLARLDTAKLFDKAFADAVANGRFKLL